MSDELKAGDLVEWNVSTPTSPLRAVVDRIDGTGRVYVLTTNWCPGTEVWFDEHETYRLRKVA